MTEGSVTLTPSAPEPAPGLPEGSEKWAARACSTTKRLSVPQVPEISLLEGLLQNLPAVFPCAFLLGPGSWWPGPGGRNQGSTGILEGSDPTCSSPCLCVWVSPTPGCVFPCVEQRGSASPCQKVGVAVPTFYESLHWHLQP